MNRNWMGFMPNGQQQDPINILNEYCRCLDSIIVAVNKRSFAQVKWPNTNFVEQKQLQTLGQKFKEVALSLQKLFKQQKKQANDINSLVKQKEDRLLEFFNQCLISCKETKYINKKASEICYSQINKRQLVSLIERMIKNNEAIKQIEKDILKSGVQNSTIKIKQVFQQNKKLLQQNKQLKETMYSHEYLIWQLVNYTENQSQIEVPNCNSNKNIPQKQLQIYVKIAEMRMVIRSLDQKLKPYREGKAMKWVQRLEKPIDVLIHKLQNSRMIFQRQLNIILTNLFTNKYDSFETDIKSCDKQNQQILRKIKSEFETSAMNTRKMCGRINDKIKLILYIGKVSVENIPKINSTKAILGEFEKSINNCETLFDIYGHFIYQVGHLSFIHSNSQTKLQQKLKGYIQDLQQIQNKIKRYELQNFFPIKKEVIENQNQKQVKIISHQHQQSAQNKRLIEQVEKYKSMIQSIINDNKEKANKRESYIQQMLKKIEIINKQKYNLQKANSQRLQELNQENQQTITKLKASKQQLLKQIKLPADQLQRIKKQFKQKQKIYEKNILSSKQTETRLTNQKNVLELKSRSLKEQISNFKESLKKQQQLNIKKISEMKDIEYKYTKKLNELKQNREIQEKLKQNIQSLNRDRNIQLKQLTQYKIKLNILLQERDQQKMQLSKGVIQFKAHINKQKGLLLTHIGHLQQRIENIATSLKNQKIKRQNTKTSIQILKTTVKQLNQANKLALQTLQKQKQQKQKLIEQISRLNRKYLSMEKQNYEIDGLNNKIQQQKIENQQFMKKQKLQIQDQKEQIDYLHSQIKTINSHNQTYRQHKQLEIQNLNLIISALRDQIQIRQRNNFSLSEQKQKCQLKITILQSQLEIEKVVSLRSEQEVKQNKTTIQQMNKQIYSLKRENDEITVIVNNKQELIKQLKDKIQNIQIDINEQRKSLISKIDELTINLTEKSSFIEVLNNKIDQTIQQNLAMRMIKSQSPFSKITSQYQSQISQLKGQIFRQQSKFQHAQSDIKNILNWLNQIIFSSSTFNSEHKETDELKKIQNSIIMIRGKVQKCKKVSESSNLLSKNQMKGYFADIQIQINKLQDSLEDILSLKQTMKLLHTIGNKLQKSINFNGQMKQSMLVDFSIAEKKSFKINEESIFSEESQFVQIENEK